VFTSTIMAAVLAFIIDRRFDRAAAWTLGAAALSFFGVIHAYTLTPQGVQNRFGLNAAPEFALLYALCGGMLWDFHQRERRLRGVADASES
jgi:AGZA family xanthine/uracil permease-like MFS transporter